MNKEWDKIEVKYVKAIMIKHIDSISNYHDQFIDIIDVPLPFPTGFCCQEITNTSNKWISGPAYTVHEIEGMIQELKEPTDKFREAVNDYCSDFDMSANQNIRNRSIERIKSKAKTVSDIVHKFIMSEVQGGVLRYVDLFFCEGSIHDLNQNNEQFFDLLHVFRALQQMNKQIATSLAEIQALLARIQQCYKHISKENQAWYNKLDLELDNKFIKLDEFALKLD